MCQAAWTAAFVEHALASGVHLDPARLATDAAALFELQGQLPPEHVADVYVASLE